MSKVFSEFIAVLRIIIPYGEINNLRQIVRELFSRVQQSKVTSRFLFSIKLRASIDCSHFVASRHSLVKKKKKNHYK